MGFGTYIAFRLVNALVVLVAVVFIASFLFNAAIERELIATIQESVNAQVGQWLREHPGASPEEVREYREFLLREEYKKYGLDKPYVVRVFNRAISVIKFEFGKAKHIKSYFSDSTDIRTIILEALPNTVLLFTTSTIITIIIGIYLGFRAARKVGSLFDRVLSAIAMITYSLPMWWTGIMMIYLFCYQIPTGLPHVGLGVVRIMMHVSIFEDPIGYITGVLGHMTLPVGTIVLVSFGGYAYVTRSVVLGVMQQDFVIAARAKGLPERKVLYGHVLRTASPSIVTMSILSLLGSLGGAIITESVFTWPGMGTLYWMCLISGDIEVLLAVTYVLTLLYLVAMVLADLLYGLLDPRVRVGVMARGR